VQPVDATQASTGRVHVVDALTSEDAINEEDVNVFDANTVTPSDDSTSSIQPFIEVISEDSDGAHGASPPPVRAIVNCIDESAEFAAANCTFNHGFEAQVQRLHPFPPTPCACQDVFVKPSIAYEAARAVFALVCGVQQLQPQSFFALSAVAMLPRVLRATFTPAVSNAASSENACIYVIHAGP